VRQGPKTPIYRSPRSSDFEEEENGTGASRAQPRSGQASSAPSTTVEGENGTGASPQELVMDPCPEEQAACRRMFSARANAAQGKQEWSELIVVMS
jgi:hypothetical protein